MNERPAPMANAVLTNAAKDGDTSHQHGEDGCVRKLGIIGLLSMSRYTTAEPQKNKLFSTRSAPTGSSRSHA
jgi:hypothetical protein